MDKCRMTFTCEEIKASIFKKLYDQKNSNRFCDLILYVNNQVVKAHRSVVACSSAYFNSILKHHKNVREHLTVNCWDNETFNAVINYMYTGQITINYSNVEELLRLADFFVVCKLSDYCAEFLGTNLNLSNCLFTYFLSQRFKLKHLTNLVENYINGRVNDVYAGKEMLQLSSSEMQEFLSNKVFTTNLQRTLGTLSEWVLKETYREKEFIKLLRCLHWSNFEPSDIFKFLEVCLFSKSEFCFYHLLHCLYQNNLLLPSFKNKYDELHHKYQELVSDDNKNNVAGKNLDKNTEKEKKGILSCNSKALIVKAKQKGQKQRLLKRLMFYSLRPGLRMFLHKHQKLFNEKNGDDTLESGVKCPICCIVINDPLLLEQHLALSHAKDVTYKCGICNFVCKYHGDYLNHMKVHFAGPPFKCDYCDTTTDQISKLISHRSKHLEESIYNCSFCSFKCRLKQNFLSHLKVHTPEKQFKCENCTKTFRFKHNLESHVLTHTSEKDLNCDSCGFHTKFLSHMIAHKRIHTGDIYRCSYPHCKFSTSKKSQLLGHAKTHNGVRPHSCGVCGRGFMEKSHLVRHERIHLEEKPFKCSSCDYASSRRDKLKEHFTRHHGENASAKVPYKARPMRTNCSSKTKSPTAQEPPVSTNGNALTFTHTNTTSTSSITQPINNDLQELIMHHQSHSTSAASNPPPINGNYSHFGEPPDFHHHNHNVQHQILSPPQNNQRPSPHQNNPVNHHMLGRSNHSTATSTAAAVAAAMMLDPRFHHGSSVPYHSSSTSASMAMAAAVQSTQQMQNPSTSQQNEYPPSLQNCMSLF